MRGTLASDMVGGCDVLSSSSSELYPLSLSSLSSKSSRSGWKDNEGGGISGVAGGDFKVSPPLFPLSSVV